MGKQYSELTAPLIRFIAAQKLFFVATASTDSRINLSPKGMDSLRVLQPNRVLWLNVTGSGNETAAHVQECARMTLMFAAFDGDPLILRLYGQARAIHHADAEWDDFYRLFPPLPGARQIFELNLDLVQTSCGMAVPLFEYIADRDQLNNWARKKGDAGLRQYWQEKNALSLDGVPTHIASKNR